MTKTSMTKRYRIYCLWLIMVLLFVPFMVSGCAMKEYADTMMADDETVQDLADPMGEHDYESEVGKAKEYYDEKTGQLVSKSQYYAYTFADQFKVYGLYVVLVSVAVGILLRFTLGRHSSSLRRASTTLIFVVPLLYGILWYLVSFVADRVH